MRQMWGILGRYYQKTGWGKQVLQGVVAALFVADADGFVNSREKDFAVADFSCLGRMDNRFNNFINPLVAEHDLNLNLGKKINAVFAAPVELGVALLPAVTTSFEHGESIDANGDERRFHVIELSRLNYCFEFRHDVRLFRKAYSLYDGARR